MIVGISRERMPAARDELRLYVDCDYARCIVFARLNPLMCKKLANRHKKQSAIRRVSDPAPK
ncbi:hypothetical protein THOM_2084 [Trachipleistophora hominis]|uniref:Uncharacterized protein n=1 Tax=Trachipleistophora hominis TaxID=72359 RepID=L7JU11_TRAHO|nr:hypothetical protein THOM_2084 [Trachipleistophora hominis]